MLLMPTMMLHALLRSRTALSYVPPLPLMRGRAADHPMEGAPDSPWQSQRRSMYAKTSTESTDTATTERYDTATELLELLLEQRNEDIEPPFEAWFRRNTPSYERLREERSKKIEALIERLTLPTLGETQPAPTGFVDRLWPQQKQASFYYDPESSLFGSGFYCTLYFYYPNTAASSSGNGKPPEDPIWEKTSLKASNIKGQQYYVRNDFQQSVINYSEVWGPAVTIKAEGILTPIGDGDNDEAADRPGRIGFAGPSIQTKEDSRTLRRLPDVFRVDATKISASIFGVSLDFDIQGSANLVVLYADPRIRIFVSPLPSETVVGNWEEAGLVVAQVRGDLVPATNQRMPRLVDLR